MAHRRIEEQISKLGELRQVPAADAVPALRKALGDRVGLMVAKAARLAGEMRLEDLAPDLLRAFDRLLENPLERDPQCWGKTAIAKALTELDYRGSAPFLRGARHVQMEPVYGGREDTAPSLRGICLLGLAACTDLRREHALRFLVEGLTDPAQTVRIEAIRALAQMDGDESALLLRLKARTGDAELAVTGQVFDALLAIEREEAIEFVARFLTDGPEGINEEAALSLGSSRLPGAVEVLEEAWTTARGMELRQAILRGISASRQESALEFLLNLVRKGRPRDAEDALEALRLHRESPEIRSKVEEALGDGERFREWLR